MGKSVRDKFTKMHGLDKTEIPQYIHGHIEILYLDLKTKDLAFYSNGMDYFRLLGDDGDILTDMDMFYTSSLDDCLETALTDPDYITYMSSYTKEYRDNEINIIK